MSDNKSPASDLRDAKLLTVLRAIAAHNGPQTWQLLDKFPLLARQAVEVGASRAVAGTYFFPEIGHYAYAGDTALHFAAAAYQPDIAQVLVSRGANVRARNRRGAEPLHYAADGSPGSDAWNPIAQQAIVAFLIRAGADPNAADKSGVTPLHRAVRTRCTAAVRTLLAHGADAIGKNKSGSTPLHLAVQNTGRGGSGTEAAQVEQAEIIRLLLSHGARPVDKDSAGRSVRESAKADWVRMLLGEV